MSPKNSATPNILMSKQENRSSDITVERHAKSLYYSNKDKIERDVKYKSNLNLNKYFRESQS